MNNRNIVRIGWAAASVLALGWTVGASAADKADSDQPLKLRDLPKSVRATLRQEAGDGQLTQITQSEGEFEAQASIGDHDYVIKVAKDGTLLSKKLDKAEKTKLEASFEKSDTKAKGKDEDDDDAKSAPSSKSKVKHEAKGKEEDEDDDDAKAAPSEKSKAKHESKARKEDDDDAKPAPSAKSKGVSKAKGKAKGEDEDDD